MCAAESQWCHQQLTPSPSRASFSNANREVDLCTDGYQVISTVPGGSYATYNGTSMAAPAAAGFAALMLLKARSFLGSDVTEPQLYA